MEELKDVIARNLVVYRKNAGLTQQEIADKINYSDKAVSKWERGDGTPDVTVLKQIADIYGVTVNDFLIVHSDKAAVKTRGKTRIAKHWLVGLLSFGLVWFVATIVMVIGLLIRPRFTHCGICLYSGATRIYDSRRSVLLYLGEALDAGAVRVGSCVVAMRNDRRCVLRTFGNYACQFVAYLRYGRGVTAVGDTVVFIEIFY